MIKIWKKNLQEAQKILDLFVKTPSLLNSCEDFSKLLINCYQAERKVLSCGNGGSHCDAMHFAEELTGKFSKPRRPLGAIALGDASHITCTANDYGFEYIFSRQVEALGKSGDVLIGLSTSGNSENVIKAVEKAKSLNIKTVGLLGKDGGKLAQIVDLPIIIPAQTSDRIQEMHIKLIHTVIETVERSLFPENYLQDS